LPRGDVGLAVIARHLVGKQRVLGPDAQDRAMGDDTVLALVGGAGGHDDHLALGLGQRPGFVHQCIMICKEGTELVRPVRKHQEHVRHKAGFLLHRQDAVANILRQLLDLRYRKAADGMVRHGGSSYYGITASIRKGPRRAQAEPRRSRKASAVSARAASTPMPFAVPTQSRSGRSTSSMRLALAPGVPAPTFFSSPCRIW